MAGDWIKMRSDLAEDPAVICIAGKVGLDEFAVVGRLQFLWAWFDAQSRDGHAAGVTKAWVDRKVQCDGFAQAMVDAEWLIVTPGGIEVPNFDRHNGETAKTRALGTKRKQKERASASGHDGVTQESVQVSRNRRDKSETREEKRRDKTPVVPMGDKDKPEIPCPYARIVELYHEHLPSLPRAKVTTAPRQRGMRSFWGWLLGSTKADGTRRATTADEALQWIASYFAQASENDFLMGRTPRSAEHKDWRCDIDYLMTPRGIKQVVERTRDAA